MAETLTIVLTAEENKFLGDALYFAILFMDELAEEYADDPDCIVYKNACKSREGFSELINRFYPEKLCGEE